MNTDKLRLFKNIDEVKEYARVNGYDTPEANDLIKQWEEIDKTPKKIKKKKILNILPEDDDTVEVK
jgi:hypothetical protein